MDRDSETVIQLVAILKTGDIISLMEVDEVPHWNTRITTDTLAILHLAGIIRRLDDPIKGICFQWIK